MANLRIRFTVDQRISPALVPGARLSRIPNSAVAGLVVPGKRSLNLSAVGRFGEPGSYEADMPRVYAHRLHDFVTRHYVRMKPNFNCFSFMRFMMGWGASDSADRPAVYNGPVIGLQRMRPFRPYALLHGGKQGGLQHGLVGLDDRYCLSVFGMHSPLILASAAHLFELYNADTVMEVRQYRFLQ